MTLLFRTPPPRAVKRYSDPNRVPGPLDARSALSPGRYEAREALEVAALVACVGMRAGAFAQLPLKSYRDRVGYAEQVPTQPELMVNPSAAVVPSVWKTQMSISRDIWGYAVGYIRAVDAAGYPSKVDWLCPGSDILAKESTSSIEWRINGQPVDASMVVHVPSRWVLPGRPLGICPLEYSGLVDLARRAQSFGRDWFVNGAMPSAILYSDTEMDPDQADSILARMLQRWARRQPAVIGSGLKYEAVSVKADESQFLETMRQVSADIAISFNLPPERINAATGKGNEYANISQNQQQYLLDSINPDLVVIQEALGRYTPRGQYLRWQTGAFLRSDLKTRYESYQIGLAGEFITVDEVRAWEELPPMPEEPVEPTDPADDMVEDATEDMAGRSQPVVVNIENHPPAVNIDNRQEPHVVNVDARQEPPVVNIDNRQEPPVVNMTTPEVVVNVPEARRVEPIPTVRRVERDDDGRIVRVIDEEQ